jgi:flagellin
VLTRLKELATQASSDLLDTTDRTNIGLEVTELTAEIDRNAGAAKFNGVALLTATADLGIQVGTTATEQITIDTSSIDARMAALNAGGALTVDLSSAANARTALTAITAAIDTVSGHRATLGAAGNRFQAAIDNIQTFAESLSAANSRIRDVDVAEESANLAKANVLQQAGISVLAQANQQPQMALKLLG